MLADRLTQKSVGSLDRLGLRAQTSILELAPLAVDIARATTTGHPSEDLKAAIAQVESSDAVIVVTPVYKAGPSGLFKSFLDVLDDDLLVATPVLLAATAGSDRHSLVVDQQLRPLFAYLRALTLPTSVFAIADDWATPEFGTRLDRAAVELAHVVASGLTQSITDDSWTTYRHEDSRTTLEAELENDDIDFDSPLMRLATGR